MPRKPLYKTDLGKAYCADSLELLPTLPDASVDLVFTSPPYALHFKKEYGNADQKDYVAWFMPFAREFKRVLKPDGSFVLNIGGSWTPGAPVRSLYHFRLLLALCDELGFNLCQEFFWYNPAKMPAPAEWVNVRRLRVKDSVEYIFWLSASKFPRADNSKVLQAYSKDMARLIKRGIKETKRPSGHNIKTTFAADKGGSIPPNLIECGNNESNSRYIKESKRNGQKVHPARFPAELPRFFIEFLTSPGDLVLDPFAGSNTTGAVAEKLGRQWIAVEKDQSYAMDSELRFGEVDESGVNGNGQLRLNLG
ncbi:MAG: site-specific DNA-methyltransferase [Planctomycetaceae bacterium]|nr:site-specific DNA-methyltransferase [Planctomycetaceae bacterium]